MRSADLATAIRVALAFVIGYLIIIQASAILVVLLILLIVVLDNVDGYLARSGRPSLLGYLSYSGKEARGIEVPKDKDAKKAPKYGSGLDIAGDRITEYVFWIVFAYLRVIPLFVVFIFITRNSVSDALTLSAGKSFSKMRTKFGRVASSHASRGLYMASKTLAFIYLSLVYIAGWPAWIGYALTAIVVAGSLIRGSAEIYEALLALGALG
jgi:phosphatidylglycerophosphate synthase